MKREYNDYLQLTRKYLRNYSIYLEAVENLTRRLRDIEVELGTVSISSPVFGEGGGKGELTSVEREADRRIERRDQYEELFRERAQLRRQLQKVKNALDALPEEECDAIRLFFFENKNYDAITRLRHWSTATCKRRINGAVRKVALMLFGQQAAQVVAFVR